MSTLPLFAAIPAEDLGTEKVTLSLSLDYKTTPREGDFPLVNVLTKLFVNGKQIGLISSFEIKVRTDEVFPQIVVRIGEGFTKETADGCSDDLKNAAQRYIAELRRFPFVHIESPFLEGPPFPSTT